jgi:hypothetical protein
MVGWAGTLQGASVHVWLLRPTPFSPSPGRLVSSVVEFHFTYQRLPYGCYPNPDTPVIFSSLQLSTHFIVFADHGETFAETLIENNGPTFKKHYAADSTPV